MRGRPAVHTVLHEIGPEARNAAPVILKVIAANANDVGTVITLTNIDFPALHKAHGPSLVAGLLDPTRNKNAGYRAALLRALAGVGPKAAAALPAIEAALKDPAAEVLCAAAEAIAAIEPKGVKTSGCMRALTSRLESESDMRKRLQIIEALGRLGPAAASAISALQTAAKEKAPIGGMATFTLNQIVPRSK